MKLTETQNILNVDYDDSFQSAFELYDLLMGNTSNLNTQLNDKLISSCIEAKLYNSLMMNLNADP